MVFIDFNMPEQGDEIIRHIRKTLHHYHLPILFYTGDKEPEKILPRIFSESLLAEGNFLNISDGIYFCDRDHISEKAKLILTSLLTKESRPQGGRGLLMDRVSEIDAKIIEALKKHYQAVPDADKPKVLELVLSKLKRRGESASAMHGSLADKSYEDVINYLLSNNRSIDTHFRAELLREMLKYIADKEANGNVLSSFYNSPSNQALPRCLVDLRNAYAHKTVEEINVFHDAGNCKHIRTETRVHLQNIKKLLDGV